MSKKPRHNLRELVNATTIARNIVNETLPLRRGTLDINGGEHAMMRNIAFQELLKQLLKREYQGDPDQIRRYLLGEPE